MLIVRALLVSTYELGHQPFGLASPAAWLRQDGAEVRCIDLARERLTDDEIVGADLIAFHLPMHTATRLAAPVIRRARALNAGARMCAYGLYAPLNAEFLQTLGVNDVLGGEYEHDLAAIARDVKDGRGTESRQSGHRPIPKLHFLIPDRSGLLPLSRYAALHMGDGTSRVTGYTEASRGCRHLCRHCPIVPVYDGQFRIVQQAVVLADAAAQIAAGAQHITFGDPDFFNGPTHAMRVVEELHDAHPSVTYDVTIKVEHVLKHRALLPRLCATGCLFVTSAVESIDDRVLAILDKGHTRADFFEAVGLCREAGLNLVPTFVAFHPWTTMAAYCDLLDTIASQQLIDQVAPIQLAIRLLIPSGSRLLDVDEMRPFVGGFDGKTLTYRWSHPDPGVDVLQAEISATVGRRLTSDRRDVFETISALAHDRAGLPRQAEVSAPVRAAVPHLDEPWYCCAEPNPEQLTLI